MKNSSPIFKSVFSLAWVIILISLIGSVIVCFVLIFAPEVVGDFFGRIVKGFTEAIK